LGAENETASNKITNFTNYKLVLGDNKIYVRINSNTPCYAVAELKLTLLSKPIINIQDIVPICENNTISIDAGADFDSYLWSNGETTPSVTISQAGNYAVTVTQNHGSVVCTSIKNFNVVLSNVAKITSVETQDWTDNENTIIVNILASSIGDYEYSIDGLNYQDNNQFTGLTSGKYTVYVIDKNGCGTTPPYDVYLLMYPKFFTPNGDGFNDTWKIKFSDIEAGLTVKIFDRYGKLIKTLVANTDSWNGTFNGAELPASDYWFVVTRANGLEYKGHFALKR
jgi:gliding motility-associated-like protein